MADETSAPAKIAANLREAADYLDNQPGILRLTLAEWQVREAHQLLKLLMAPPSSYFPSPLEHSDG